MEVRCRWGGGKGIVDVWRADEGDVSRGGAEVLWRFRPGHGSGLGHALIRTLFAGEMPRTEAATVHVQLLFSTVLGGASYTDEWRAYMDR